MARHHHYGDVAFLLEPQLKEGRGGLRDVHALRAVALAIPTLPPLEAEVRDAWRELVEVRVALHRTTGKSSDLFVLQQQAAVAEMLGFPDTDTMLHRVSSAARTISWASDDMWRRVESTLAGPERPDRHARPRR